MEHDSAVDSIINSVINSQSKNVDRNLNSDYRTPLKSKSGSLSFSRLPTAYRLLSGTPVTDFRSNLALAGQINTHDHINYDLSMQLTAREQDLQDKDREV